MGMCSRKGIQQRIWFQLLYMFECEHIKKSIKQISTERTILT